MDGYTDCYVIGLMKYRYEKWITKWGRYVDELNNNVGLIQGTIFL